MIMRLLLVAWLVSDSHSWLSPHQPRLSLRLQTATDANTSLTNDNILEDSSGSINRELAERIWNWEQERRSEAHLPKLDFSVRAGLRLVDELASEAARGRGSVGATSYSDLVQEGLFALLDAMAQYTDASGGFEKFARKLIRRQLRMSIQSDSDVRLPRSVRSVVRHARQVAQQLRRDGERPKLAAVAKAMNMDSQRLQDYLQLAQSTVSMESTVEVSHPMLEDAAPAYRDQEDWELKQGFLLDTGHETRRDQIVEDFLDESMDREGDDDAWIQQQEQVAGRLQDMIPDDSEPSPDDQALADMIRADLSDFLTSTLIDPDAIDIVRMAFGLDAGEPMTVPQMADALNLEEEDVERLLTDSMDKLRTSYMNRYVEPYLEDDSEDYVIDSV